MEYRTPEDLKNGGGACGYEGVLTVGLWGSSAQATTFFDTSFETCAVGTGNDFPCEGWDDFGKENIIGPTHNKIEITNALAFSGSKIC